MKISLPLRIGMGLISVFPALMIAYVLACATLAVLADAYTNGELSGLGFYLIPVGGLSGSLLVACLWRPEHSTALQVIEVAGAGIVTVLFLIFIELSVVARVGDWVVRPYWAYLAFHFPRIGRRQFFMALPFTLVAIATAYALLRIQCARVQARRRASPADTA